MGIKRDHEIRRIETRLALLCLRCIVTLQDLMCPLQRVNALQGHAQDTLSAYKGKAAYLLNFLNFVEWPEESFADPLAPIGIDV